MHAAPGTVVAGRYRLDADVAAGHDRVASVWRGRDLVLDRPVRVRLIDRDHPLADAVLAAARSRAAVDDHRVTHVLDADHDDDAALLVTSWPSGTTVEDLLVDGPLDPPDALAVVRAAAEVLAAAHEQGVAHLCLGPADVVLGPDAEVTVLGLAVDALLRGVDVPTDPSARARADARVLGALLYTCLTARAPGDALAPGTASTVLEPAPTTASGDPCTPRQLRAAVPATVDLLCRRALGEDAGGGTVDSPGAFLRELDGLHDDGRARRAGWRWFGGRTRHGGRDPVVEA